MGGVVGVYVGGTGWKGVGVVVAPPGNTGRFGGESPPQAESRARTANPHSVATIQPHRLPLTLRSSLARLAQIKLNHRHLPGNDLEFLLLVAV